MVYTGYSQIAASLDFRPIVIWRRSAADGRCVTQLMESWFQERKWRMIAIYLTEKMDTELIATTLRWARNKTYLKIETAVFLSSFISFEIRSAHRFCSFFLFVFFFSSYSFVRFFSWTKQRDNRPLSLMRKIPCLSRKGIMGHNCQDCFKVAE